MSRCIWRIVLACGALLVALLPIESSAAELFPFGAAQGDSHLTTDIEDGSSSEFQLTTPIVFYDKSYTSLYINANGLLSFLTEIPSFFNVQFPLDYPVIAPFYADVDTRGSGTIYYRETQAPDVLDRVNRAVHRHFLTGTTFTAKSALVVTWDSVGFYNAKDSQVNTFQVVIVTDGQQSYAIFNYADIQWIMGEGKSSNLPDARAQAGFMSGDGRTHLLQSSGTDQIRNVHRISNVGERGQWMFHIGNTGPNGNVLEPDINLGEAAISFQTPQSCSVGAALCHQNAICRDYYPGFCCECGSGFFGNGRNCLQEGAPVRLNGKVTGNLNGEHISDSDLHSYVVTSEGRAYTAISRIPPALGFDIQTLLPLGAIVGWLFATPRGKARNGYQITGGMFNHSVEVKFPQTGHNVRIRQSFQGLDVFGNLRVTSDIQGNLPSIPFDTKIEMDDYDEEYTQDTKGLIRSHGTRQYRHEGSQISTPLTVEQTIEFDECAYADSDAELNVLRLKVARNYIVYDPREEVIRYAVTNKISPLTTEDPCQVGSQECGHHSSCVVEGDSFRCVCNRGYEQYYAADGHDPDRAVCVDINECTAGTDNCHNFAECVNHPGSFTCRCLPGYQGDGFNCHRHTTCADLQCDKEATCYEGHGKPAECRCNPGYQGNGLICIFQPDHDCQEEEICDPNADCVYNGRSQRHECQCLPGYTGDGIVCIEELESCDVHHNCHPSASCVYDQTLQSYYCVCNAGYKGDGYNCEPADPSEISCNVINNCHPHAQCIYDSHRSTYACRCSAGFSGNGYTCEAVDVTCDQVNICSIYAQCVYDRFQGVHVCRCNDEYTGDGRTCTPTDECNSHESCHQNGQCVYDNVARRYRCQCNSGYTGNGRECHQRSDVTCDIINNCHPNAKCIYDSINLRYQCHCGAGYHGDGIVCAKSTVSCNEHNRCHPNADCAYDEGHRGYRCQCKQGFTGDGDTCIPNRSCQNDQSLCDRNAECILHHAINQYTCQCRHGYQGDGYSCRPIPTHEGNFLLVNQGMTTLKIPLASSSQGRPLVVIAHQTALGIDIDCIDGKFYWADVAGGVIRRANYDGSNNEVFIDQSITSPESVAVDWVSRNVFWTDSGKDTIEVARIDKPDRKVIINTGLVNPRGIIVHPGRGKMYWTDWDRQAPKIESADMDGKNREVFVGDHLGLPNSLTIDYDRGELCWADAGTQKIECMNLSKYNRRTIIAPVSYPFGITNNKESFFWTDWETKQIHSASKAHYHLNAPMSSPLGGNSKLYGIVVVPESCPRESNPCGSSNGGCQNLCLPNSYGSRTCMCSDYGTEEEMEACNEVS